MKIHPQNNTEKMKFRDFLKIIREKSRSPRELGNRFERAIRDFLKASPEHDFEDVWLWNDWPDLKKYGFSKDLGIDLVAQERETGKFWAIQCKCYKETLEVRKENIDSFFNHSGKEPFEVRLIVTTTNKWSENAEQSLKNQKTMCHTLKLSDLEQVDFEWYFSGKAKRGKNRKILNPHQIEAVNKTFKHFKDKDRGKLIMACGTGKTLTSLAIVEKATPENAKVLFLAPSIALISQTLREYAYERKAPQRYLAVCSDAKVGEDESGTEILQTYPTTNPQRIAEALKIKSNKRTIVFCTYQSLKHHKKF